MELNNVKSTFKKKKIKVRLHSKQRKKILFCIVEIKMIG